MKKAIKYLAMAALALMTAACSNDDNELTQHSANNMITVTAKLAPKSSSALTRAVSDKGDGKITVDWAKTETMKIISNNGYEATATITNVDGTGTPPSRSALMQMLLEGTASSSILLLPLLPQARWISQTILPLHHRTAR